MNIKSRSIYNKYLKTVEMSAKSLTNGGTVYLFASYLLKIVYLAPLLLLWRTLANDGADIGMPLSKMLTYTYLGALFSEMLVVRTPACNWFYEGLFISLYQRPSGILADLAAQAVGGWMPQLLLFSLPMVIAAPLFGVSMTIYSVWFFPSLILCISLGFAIDYLFACLAIRLNNTSWLVYVIRMAVVSLLSGSVIPFSVLPGNIGIIFQYMPMGSLAGAPLSIYTGLAEPTSIIAVQLLWNIVLWPTAIFIFRKSSERMVSYGG